MVEDSKAMNHFLALVGAALFVEDGYKPVDAGPLELPGSDASARTA